MFPWTVCSEVNDVELKILKTMSGYTTEEINNFVSGVFDELRLSLLEKETFHPSENCHRQWWFRSDSEPYDIINSYHIFCHLCGSHVYSRSVPTDINSFFDLHINTEYHQEFRSGFPHSEEMIVWMEKWKTGKCNACQISNLYAFVIDMDEIREPEELFKLHYCIWGEDLRVNNSEILRKINLLKKYCQLSIFQEKFIRQLDKETACLLCCSKIPWSLEKVKGHLGSQVHLNHFSQLVWNKFNFSPKDLLNGFNLEEVTRWIHRCNFKCPPEYEDYSFRKLECSLSSRNTFPKYAHMSDTGAYIPQYVERVLEVSKGKETWIMPDTGLILSASYTETVKNYKELQEGLTHVKLKVGRRRSYVKLAQDLFLKKYVLIKKPFPELSNDQFMCRVCDLRIPAPLAVNHATDPGHLFHSMKWQELLKSSADDRFFEAFEIEGIWFLCLLCGVSAENSHFFTHLKSALHGKRFQEYCALRNEVPISSAIQVQNDHSIVCFVCDKILVSRINRKGSKVSLKVLRTHWPCSTLIKHEKEKEKTLEESKGLSGTCLICGCAESHKVGCLTNLLNFKCLENAVGAVLNGFEETIFQGVLGKIQSATRLTEQRKRRRKRGINIEIDSGEREDEEFGKTEVETNRFQCTQFVKEEADEEELKCTSDCKRFSLSEDMLSLLERPLYLLDFVTNLAVAAAAAVESLHEINLETAVCTSISNAVRTEFPLCSCYPFGSRYSGLKLGHSDFDVFLDVGNMYHGMENTSSSAMKKLIYKVSKLLRKNKEVTNLTVIATARVPIISFLHTHTGLRCDLSLKSALSVHNTLLIRFLVSLDYQAKLIILFLRHWIKANGIHGPPFFSSYAITLMAIFYFQQLNPPMMPTVEELQNAFTGQRMTIGGWDCNFNENQRDFKRQNCNYPIHIILQGFFTYYAKFDYDRFVISPLNGKPVPRAAFTFDSGVKLPMCYKRHLLNFPKGLETLVSEKIPICLIDPFDLSYVLTKGFTANGLKKFIHFCVLSAKALKKGVVHMLFCNEENKT